MPRIDKVGIWTGDPAPDPTTRRDSAVDHFDGEA